MELPHLGRQCEAESCQRLDFLPIHCKRCGGTFCKDHSPSTNHGCLGVEEEGRKKEEEQEQEKEEQEGGELAGGKITRHPCQVAGCMGGELTPVLCPGCGLNFCLPHRHQPDHSCPNQPQYGPSETQEAAAAHLREITAALGDSRPQRAPGRRSEHLSAKVQLMKLKQKAVGEKGIPQEDRLYLLVFLPKSSSSSSSCSSSSSSCIAVFVSRCWTVGRAIDAVAACAKVQNNNNISGAPKLRLFRPGDGALLGAPDQPLEDLLATHCLLNGQSVVLECVGEGAMHLPTCRDDVKGE